MGYEIYITRRTTWSAEGPPEIFLAEWQAAASQFPELVVINNPMYEDGRGLRGKLGWSLFWYVDGKITAKKPTRQALLRMCALAKTLNARVIGDDDEVYDEHGVPDKIASFIPRDD